MKRYISALSGLSLFVIASLAFAQAQTGPGPAAPAETAGNDLLTEIVVTARRKSESLQDVPIAVTAITSSELQKFNILQFQDIGQLAAGIQVSGGNISMRGVTYQTLTATPAPTTATYLNDAPVLSSELAAVIFDIGQIEVLRGPQGTLHGISTPSGALTVTTRKPDLEQFGGDVQGTVASHDAYNLQGAINLPAITDKLAFRLAAVTDHNDITGTRSVHNSLSPYTQTDAGRVSVRFDPIDTIDANLMYQHIYIQTRSYGSAVFGSGSPGGVNPNAPAGYNGPVIGEKANLAVADAPNIGDTLIDNVVGQLNWDVAGQRLSYVGSYQLYHTEPGSSDSDSGNIIPNYAIPGGTPAFTIRDTIDTNELRLSSVEQIAGIFDYVLGGFHSRDSVETAGNNGAAAFLSGAFGSPLTTPVPAPVAPNTRYQINTLINTPRTIRETSFFANLTAHITDKLEITAGGRHIDSKVDASTTITTTPAFIAFPLPPAFCAGAHGQFGATYPNVCDIPVPSQNGIAPVHTNTHNDAWVYAASISYHFTPDMMVYAQTGTSWRQGPYSIGVNNANNDPTLNSLVNHTPETSKSYEVGFKSSFLDHRIRLNVDYFHQTYDGLIYAVPYSVYYLSYSGAPNPTVAQYPAFVANVPATVDGVDLDLAAQVTTRWTVGVDFSYADSRLNNALVPCNDGNFDGVPDSIVPTVAAFQAAGKYIAQCKSSAGASTAPKWNANLQSEYDQPVTSGANAFIRGLLNYQPSNPNLNQNYVVPSYGLLDLWLGVRDPAQRWEVALFAKNVTDTNKVVTLASSQILGPGGLSTVFGPTGYTTVSYTPRRQFGLNVLYAFGSR
jgi:iron complex outermembrane recepter protein